MTERIASDMDGGWKQIIDDLFEEFFRFFFPAIHASIDFGKGSRLLDKELAGIMTGVAIGRREADKLFEVHWRGDRDERVMVHIEVQAWADSTFSERMFVYNTRIRSKYGRRVLSLALLVDDSRNFCPDRCEWTLGGCELSFRYPVVKLLDFKTEAELFSDRNPFALAALVQRGKFRAAGDAEARFRYKVAYARELIGRRYSRDWLLKLLRFMDYVLRLPAGLAERYQGELARLEEDCGMPFLTTFEQKALEQGIEQGIEQGLRQGIINALRQTLEVRFGDVPESLLEGIEQTKTLEEVAAIHRQALTADSINELLV